LIVSGDEVRGLVSLRDILMKVSSAAERVA